MLNQTPNFFTLGRMCLVPVLGYLILARQFSPALLVAVIAGISDAVDGFLAKRFGWVTRFGMIMDPLADKLMIIVAFAALARVGLLPWWLVLVTLGRDLVIVLGGILYHFMIEPLQASPTRISKLNTLLQIVLLAAILVQAGIDIVWPWLIDAGIKIVAATTLVSLIQYLIIWTGKARYAWQTNRS